MDTCSKLLSMTKKRVLILHTEEIVISEFTALFKSVIKDFDLADKAKFEMMTLFSHKDKKTLSEDRRQWIASEKYHLSKYDYLLVLDAEYFKLLTGIINSEYYIGSILTSELVLPKLIYLPTYKLAKFDVLGYKKKLQNVFKSLLLDIRGQYIPTGHGIIHEAKYPNTLEDIKQTIQELHQYETLTLDIEAKSLKFTDAGIWSIAFAWSKHEGVAFGVDCYSFGSEIRKLLREFFDTYTGQLIVHKANYDITVLVYVLYMEEDFTDIKNQVLGINTLCKNLYDTLLIAYLATNSCQGNTLGLKSLAAPFAGNWGIDVTDVTSIPVHELLKYNLIDVLATYYVYEEYFPKLVQEHQISFYENHFQLYLKDCIRMQLNGMPINQEKVEQLYQSLMAEKTSLIALIKQSTVTNNMLCAVAETIAVERNKKLKKKQVTWEDCLPELNLSSSKQIQELLYGQMQLPIIEVTDKGAPSISKGTVRTLVNHTINQEYKDILTAIADYKDIEKILTAFIPAFRNPSKDKHGKYRLTGFFNLGGTVSGRMSSSDINLQQLPSTGSRFAKPVKECFTSSDEWIMCGIDFTSLEAKIDALTTKDPEKLKVYEEGWDSHCLNAVIAFGSQMPDIDPEDKDSVNSIKEKYPKLRQSAKTVGFALQYGGTAYTLQKNSGLSMELANDVFNNYHQAYSKSLEWKESKINQAKKDGYITAAFGLKVRTPALKYAGNKLNNTQSAEARTAGNALGQSWGLLNNRAMREVLQKIDDQGLTEDIYPIAAIHDACYYMVRNKPELIQWLNQATVEASYWQNHSDIAHDKVKLGGELDVFFPSWANAHTLSKNASVEDISQILKPT